MSLVELDHLTKLYKNGRGIQDLSLNIEKGQIYGLLGPNGSGKTTTMKIMTGLVHPDRGSAKILGVDPNVDIENSMKAVGCLIEAPSYYPYLSAKQNLQMIQNLYPKCPAQRIHHVLEQVDLYPYKDEKVSKFSLGMKQRLGLAMALLSDPELLILDEPSNGLDIEGMADVRELLVEQSKKGKTILISSHLAAELEQICTDVAVIREGKLLSTAKVPELLLEYGNLQNYYLTLVNRKKENIA